MSPRHVCKYDLLDRNELFLDGTNELFLDGKNESCLVMSVNMTYSIGMSHTKSIDMTYSIRMRQI